MITAYSSGGLYTCIIHQWKLAFRNILYIYISGLHEL